MNADPAHALVYTRQAAAAARSACHAAYNSPRESTQNVYDRTGASFDLLRSTEQALRMLADDVDRLRRVATLRSTDTRAPAEHADDASSHLHAAARRLADASHLVNAAWSALSPLYVELPDAP